MATKPNNIVKFYGEGYGEVHLVKRSLAKRWFAGAFYDPITRETAYREFWYWQGQLVHNWSGEGIRPGEKWGEFYKGQIVWLDAGIFNLVIEL